LDTLEEAEIIQYAQTKQVRIELIGMDRLAIEICSKYLILAKDFPGIFLSILAKYCRFKNSLKNTTTRPVNWPRRLTMSSWIA
jgi:hypothetical protein